jgi:hypothetical protein
VLSYENLYNAPVDKLKANVDDWTDLIGKLKPIAAKLRSNVAAPLKSARWTGDAADAAQSFIGETAKEFDDAIKEATGIRDILREAHDRFRKQRDELHRIAGQEAPAEGLRVEGNGEVVQAGVPVSAGNPYSWRGKPTYREAFEHIRAKIAEFKLRIERARVDATEADDTAAWALHVNLGGQQHNFSPPAHRTLAQAWEAGSEGNFTGAQNYIFDEMQRNQNSETVKRIKDLLSSGNPIDRAKAYGLWASMVAPGREWDHKPKLRERYGLETKNELFFKDPKGNRAVSYDIWSNIHYGYVGRAAGLSRFELEKGAQVPIVAGRTDAGDKITVRVGEDLYDKYGPNLTQQQFQQEVDKALREMESKRAGQVKPWP